MSHAFRHASITAKAITTAYMPERSLPCPEREHAGQGILWGGLNGASTPLLGGYPSLRNESATQMQNAQCRRK